MKSRTTSRMKSFLVRAKPGRGLTLIELLVSMAIIAILLTVAVGGFGGGNFSRKRIEGVANELVTDLQLARGEAVARNSGVRLTFGTDCYVVHTVTDPDPTAPSATSCDTAASPVVTLGAGEAAVKFATRDPTTDATLTRQPNPASLNYFHFDPRNGAMTTDGGVNAGVLLGSTAGAWQVRVRVSLVGRVQLCTPSTPPLSGYPTC